MTSEPATRVDTTLGSTREGRRMLAAWWGALAIDYQRHGAASNACTAATTAAHLAHLVMGDGGAE